MNLLRVCIPLTAIVASSLLAQEPAAQVPAADGSNMIAETKSAAGEAAPDLEPPGGKRVFGVLPNYRTADASQEGTVLTPHQKLVIASKDSFDYPLVLLAGALAGVGQLSGQSPSFGQGMKGYGHRLLTNYADQASGNMLTEGVFPVLLHEDPRYFRRGTGSTLSRVAYALSRVMVTHQDSGGRRFNYSEWLGNASSVAISNLYYPDQTLAGNATKLVLQVGTDAASQVMKEFWPDIKRKLLHRGSD